MSDISVLETLGRTEMTGDQQQRLFDAIGAIFDRAIDIRSPGKRPAGKAGLRAEKGYYRLLYLESDYRKRVAADSDAGEAEHYDWQPLIEILGRLKDLPELRQELVTAIESALADILAHPAPPAGHSPAIDPAS